MLKQVQKIISDNWVVILALLVGVVGIGRYSFVKNEMPDTMTSNRAIEGSGSVGSGSAKMGVVSSPQRAGVAAAGPVGTNSDYAKVQGIQTSSAGLPATDKRSVNNPADLLPNDSNSEWARLNPSGQGDISQVTTLEAGHHLGMTAQVLRNANLQLRSDPPIPQGASTGPFNQPTISADTNRVTLELGVAPGV
jgi:hypothetical protein